MREENLKVIRAKCIEVNPEKVWRIHDDSEVGHMEMTVRLADVLTAMPVGIHLKTMGKGVRVVAYNEEGDLKGLEWWNLPKDNLEEQSDECLAFLADLLTK